MSVSDEDLMAYADGELDAERRAVVEAALAADAGLRAKLDAHRTLSARFAPAFDGALQEAVPARLLAAAQPQRVVDFAARRAARRWSYREWGAMAASLACGLFLGFGATGGGPVSATGEGLAARGALRAALDTQLAAEQGGAARIGLSFRNRDGDYCRTFALPEQKLAGLACRAAEGWRLAMTSAFTPAGDIRQAGSETPPEILAAVDAMIVGEALDAAGEDRAARAGWRD